MQILMREKAGGKVIHYGIMVTPDQIYDMEPNNENKLSKTMDEFADGKVVYAVSLTGDFAQMFNRLMGKVGVDDDYNVLQNNCEHFVNEVATGEKFSNQVNRSIWAFGLSGLLGIIISIKQKSPVIGIITFLATALYILHMENKIELHKGDIIYAPNTLVFV